MQACYYVQLVNIPWQQNR